MKDRLTVAAIVALTAIAVVSAWLNRVIAPGPEGSESALQHETLERLRQCTLDLVVYMVDNDHVYPPDTSSLKGALMSLAPEKRSVDEALSLNPGCPEFLGNGSLAARPEATLVDPEHTVFFYDSAPWKDGKRTVSYAEGRTVRISEGLFQKTLTTDWITPRSGSK